MLTGGFFDSITESKEIVLEIKFGQGGEDSKLFVDNLLSAYL